MQANAAKKLLKITLKNGLISDHCRRSRFQSLSWLSSPAGHSAQPFFPTHFPPTRRQPTPAPMAAPTTPTTTTAAAALSTHTGRAPQDPEQPPLPGPAADLSAADLPAAAAAATSAAHVAAGSAHGGVLPTIPTAASPPSSPPPRPSSPPKDTRYPFPLPTLERALQIPPLDHMVGSHVAHLVAHRSGPAAEVLAELLRVPQELLDRLIWFGAVYYCPVPPLPPPAKGSGGGSAGGGGGGAGDGGGAPSLPAEQLASIKSLRQAAIAKWGKHSRHQTPRRLASPDQPVSEGGYLRAHLHPKRFPVAHQLGPRDWERRLLAVAADHVVVNKPPGLQVPPTVDNVQESLLACVEKALSLEPGCLHPAHRLDAGTEGVVVLSRDSAFASYFRGLMGDQGGKRAVRKQYRCLLGAPLPEELLPPAARDAVLVDGGSSCGNGSSSGIHSSGADGREESGKEEQEEDEEEEGRRCGGGDGVGGGVPLVHWVLEDQRQPGEAAHSVVVAEGTPGAQRCELRIDQVERVRLGPSAEAMWGLREAHEVTLTLVTGRTHQVRVQMAAIGRPLLGDRLYGALVSRQQQRQQQQQQQQQQEGQPGPEPEAEERQSAPGRALQWCLPALMDPLAPLALQAHSLTILEDGRMGPAPARFCAGEPWWRR